MFKEGKTDEGEELTEFSPEILDLVNHKSQTHSFFFELWLLLNRDLLIVLRNKLILANKIGQSIVVGIVIAIIWNNVVLFLFR